MFRRFFERAWSAAVTAAEFVIRAVADAVGVSTLPLRAVRGNSSLPAACKAAVHQFVRQAHIAATGTAAKAAVAKVGMVATKLGMTPLASSCAALAPISPTAVGTVVIGAGLCVLFVAAVWLVKRVVKEAGEFIEALADVGDTEETIQGLALAA